MIVLLKRHESSLCKSLAIQKYAKSYDQSTKLSSSIVMAIATGAVCVGLASGLMLFKLVLWLFLVRPEASLPANSLYFALTALMIWSYARAMLVQPRGLGADAKVVAAMEASAPEAEISRYCEVCDRAKPAFVHHCSVCQRCVYRMVGCQFSARRR